MSNKNLSQSITEAWKTAVETGQRLDENKQKREQEVSKIFDSARTDVIQHVLENDHGFYRPDVDPFFSAVDGGMLRRQRLTEQEAPMPPEAGPALDDETKERRKRYETAFEGPITGREQGKIDSEMEAIKKREEEEIARRDRQAQTGINPDSERYRGRENEAGLRGDPDFDPTAPGSQRQVRAAQVRDALAGVRGPKYGDRLSSENTGTRGSIQVGQVSGRELSPEERERQREEQAGRSRAGAEERLKGLDAARREKLEKGLAPDADLDTVTTAIARERGGQDRVSKLQAAGYGEGDYDPSTGGLTDQGRKKRADRQLRAGKRRAGVRARAEARENIQRTKADARAARLAARREARKKERLSGSGTALAGDKPAGNVGAKIFTDPSTQSSGGRTTEIGGAPESPQDPSSISIGMKETGTDGKTYVWDGQVWELAQ